MQKAIECEVPVTFGEEIQACDDEGDEFFQDRDRLVNKSC